MQSLMCSEMACFSSVCTISARPNWFCRGAVRDQNSDALLCCCGPVGDGVVLGWVMFPQSPSDND